MALDKSFKRVKFPSTITRHPRSILNYYKLKANELRAVLLCGHPIFEKFIKRKYYEHFKKLVLAVHLAESRALTKQDIEIVNKLCYEFLLEFSDLYRERHKVQVVHSIIYIAESMAFV